MSPTGCFREGHEESPQKRGGCHVHAGSKPPGVVRRGRPLAAGVETGPRARGPRAAPLIRAQSWKQPSCPATGGGNAGASAAPVAAFTTAVQSPIPRKRLCHGKTKMMTVCVKGRLQPWSAGSRVGGGWWRRRRGHVLLLKETDLPRNHQTKGPEPGGKRRTEKDNAGQMLP